MSEVGQRKLSPSETLETTARAGRAGYLWRGLRRSPLALLGGGLAVFLALVAVLAPGLALYDPVAPELAQRLEPPGTTHPFGTDELGRDIYSRSIYGTRIDLVSAVLVIAVAGSFGATVGVIGGWTGAWFDELVMRTADMFLAFPPLILAMAISAVLKPNLSNALVALSVTWWPAYARIARGQVLMVRELEYVEAAKAEGATSLRIVLYHVLPNSVSPLLIQGTLDMGGVILTAAALSFIGFGAQPPTPEWGRMIAEGTDFVNNQWWVSTFPGLAIFLSVLGFSLVGDALRDLFDPRLRF